MGSSSGEGNGNLLQYSCLENSMDRGAWQAEVHVVSELDRTVQLTLSLSYRYNIKKGKKEKKNIFLLVMRTLKNLLS